MTINHSALTSSWQRSVEYGLVMAGALLTLVPVAVLFLLVQRTFISSIATAGIR